MKSGDMESCGRQMLRKMRCLIFASLLPCALSMQHAAALTFDETAADELLAAGNRWFSEEDSIEESSPSRMVDEKKLVWSFRAGYMLMMGMSNSTDDKLLQVFLESGPQLFLDHGKVPQISVRFERQF